MPIVALHPTFQLAFFSLLITLPELIIEQNYPTWSSSRTSSRLWQSPLHSPLLSTYPWSSLIKRCRRACASVSLLCFGPSLHELPLQLAVLFPADVWYCIILWTVSIPHCVETGILYSSIGSMTRSASDTFLLTWSTTVKFLANLICIVDIRFKQFFNCFVLFLRDPTSFKSCMRAYHTGHVPRWGTPISFKPCKTHIQVSYHCEYPNIRVSRWAAMTCTVLSR